MMDAGVPVVPGTKDAVYEAEAGQKIADATFLPSTVAVPCATPTGPLTLIISTSNVSTSPGTTFPLNFALLTPPKNAIFPLYSSAEITFMIG